MVLSKIFEDNSFWAASQRDCLPQLLTGFYFVGVLHAECPPQLVGRFLEGNSIVMTSFPTWRGAEVSKTGACVRVTSEIAS